MCVFRFVVWMCRLYREKGKLIAVKRTSFTKDRERERFHDEVMLHSMVNEADKTGRVVQLYDASPGMDENGEKAAFLKMEFLSGGSLRDLAKAYADEDRWMPFSMILRIAYDVATALQSTHAAHVIHRDLKRY